MTFPTTSRGPRRVFVAFANAATYAVTVQYKSSSGKVTADERKLCITKLCC